MKIIVFYQYFGTPAGSWSTRIYELARRWVSMGHQVTVVTAPYDKSDIEADGLVSRQCIDGIELIIINSGDSNQYPLMRRVWRALGFAYLATYFALSSRYDTLIASSGPMTVGIPLVFSAYFRRKPTIFEVRDLWPAGGIEMGFIKKTWQKKIALWFEKLCYKSAKIVVAASPGQRSHIINRFPNLRVEVIPNASDLDLFGNDTQADQLPTWIQGKLLFTHIGSLGFIHNIRFWMEVALALKAIDKENEILFVFIGDGADRRMLESLKTEWGLSQVHFLGLLPKNMLPRWVQQSIATLFATLDNPIQNTCSPNKIFDSFAASTPIIQSSTGWIKDLVEKEACGINVNLNDPKTAAEAIYNLSKSPETVKKLGENALRLAQTRFNRNLLAKKYLDFIIEE